MPTKLKVEWIKTTDCVASPTPITHVGGKAGQFEWEHAYPLAIGYVENNVFSYYLTIDNKSYGLDICRTAIGERFLRARAGDLGGSDVADLLLRLPRKANRISWIPPRHLAEPDNDTQADTLKENT